MLREPLAGLAPTRSHSSRVRRARPLLGTLVEILAVTDRSSAIRATTAAFEAIASVHRLMSAHEPDSDVGRLNRCAHGQPVRVDAQTWQVLEVARRISAASRGAFDVCVAPVLARWGYLPDWVGRGCDATAGWEAIELLPDCHVRFRAPVAIDLGGIAKGYAVDRASAVLRAHGVARFTVNAGGDLRIGDGPETVHVRDPACPRRLLPLAAVSDAAVATSGAYFAAQTWHGRLVHPIVVPGSRRCTPVGASVTVLAPECIVADALTKVVAVLDGASEGVLARFGAAACVIAPTGDVRRIGALTPPVAA